ncbi:MAG: hypothetical protein HY788_07525 [Deltaproteobacteria bacterium]|nr:hypothetical protein [Deltaproteobacteria bacterium]
MPMPKEAVFEEMKKSWKTLIKSMEKSIKMLEKDIDEAREMTDICTDEWCEATEHVIDEIANALYSMSEPRWSTEEDNKKIKQLKKRVHDLYANYKAAAGR